MDDLLREFLTETADHLDILDVELVKLEIEPRNAEILANIFRRAHTIKGTCGFLGLPRLQALTHAAEGLLTRYRDGAPATADGVTSILDAIDRMRETLSHLQQTGVEPQGSDDDLIARLAAGAEAIADPRHMRSRRPSADRAADSKPVIASASSIRIQISTLENLMEMVSELAFTRDQLLDTVRRLDEKRLCAPLQRLSNITAELQSGLMQAHMHPIGDLWRKLPRLVRDLSQELGKPIRLRTEGDEIALDRQVLEMIKDPLTHMVRNCADHGLEDARMRRDMGKPEVGCIGLSARQEGSHVIVEISDDGRGLDTERIRAKAAELGLATPRELCRMPEAQLHMFLFQPGFTTATSVTSLSGRGVGLDVARSNIDLIGGSIDVRSAKGEGTTFSIKIPLTLAVLGARRGQGSAEACALLVDCNAFFRGLLTPVISAAGYRVTQAASAAEALRLQQQAGPFDIVIAALDLPDMTAERLARELRRDAAVSLIGLSSRLSDSELESSRRAGFQAIVGKFDRKRLAEALAASGARWAAAA